MARSARLVILNKFIFIPYGVGDVSVSKRNGYKNNIFKLVS